MTYENKKSKLESTLRIMFHPNGIRDLMMERINPVFSTKEKEMKTYIAGTRLDIAKYLAYAVTYILLRP